MPKANSNEREKLLTLEKLVKKVIRKSLKNNTLDYTVQISVSSLEPAKVKYSAMISSPANGVQPVLLTYDAYEKLEEALKVAETTYNARNVEIAFHENRINTYKSKVAAHEARKAQLEDPSYNEEDDVEMEEVATDE